MSSSVVVLNKNYQFWTEVPLKKVLKWLVLDKIEILEFHDSEETGSFEFRIKMPLVVRLLNFVGYKPKRETVVYSDEAVFNRDDNTCQYWHFDESTGKRFKYKVGYGERTIDHVLPLSRGGKRISFENCVCCCRWHNEKVKKNRTPDEVGLELIRKPFVPKRNKNEFVVIKFSYNKNKVAHMAYVKKFLGMEGA